MGEEWPDYTGNGRSIQAQADVARASFSTLLLAEGTVRLYDHLSLGLTADYALIPIAMEIPGLPELDLPAQTVMPGNLGIGVVLALHF